MPRTGSAIRSGASESVVGSSVGNQQTHQTFAVKCVEKRPGGPAESIINALTVDGKVSACSRGGPLSARLCQVCKDVAQECKDGIQCKFLAKKIEAHLLSNYPKGAPQAEMCDDVFRFVKDLASNGNLRAKQVMGTNLKPNEQRVQLFVTNHNVVVQKLAWCQEQLQYSKTPQQVETALPDFLTSIKADNAKHEVAAMMELFKMLEEFLPFLAKQREETAAKGGDKKRSMHADSDYVDKFFGTQKFFGDRAYMKAVLLMGCS